MQWLTLAGTLLGAFIGVGSTLIVDRRRWLRERSKALFETRRQLYSDFLADLSTTREILRTVALGYHPVEIPRVVSTKVVCGRPGDGHGVSV